MIDKDILWCEWGYEGSTAFDVRDRPEYEHELVMPKYRVGNHVIIKDSGEKARVIRIVQGTFPRRYLVKLLGKENPVFVEMINELMELE